MRVPACYAVLTVVVLGCAKAQDPSLPAIFRYAGLKDRGSAAPAASVKLSFEEIQGGKPIKVGGKVSYRISLTSTAGEGLPSSLKVEFMGGRNVHSESIPEPNRIDDAHFDCVGEIAAPRTPGRYTLRASSADWVRSTDKGTRATIVIPTGSCERDIEVKP